MYMPKLARFTGRDPLPANGVVVGGLPQYAYATNNPINRVDPSGLEVELPEGVLPAEVPRNCGYILREAAFGAKFSKLFPCAAALLLQFLYKTRNFDPCPDACVKALKNSGLPFIIDEIVEVAKEKVACDTERKGQRHFSGTHTFVAPAGGTLGNIIKGATGDEKTRVALDLNFALKQVSWTASAVISIKCGKPDSKCCCKCGGRTGFEARITDTFDFCSSIPKKKGFARSMAICGCVAQKTGDGTPYRISCPVTLYARELAEYERCEKKTS